MAREKPPADGQYVVEDGDWVGSVALRYGFADWKQDVWMRGENAQLRDLRKDPHTLGVGDVLFIPQWRQHTETRATEKRHVFRMKVPSEVLRIRLLDEDRKPIANEPYVLEVDLASGGGTYTQTNHRTNGDGILTEPIPSSAIGGRLRLPNLNLVYPLRLGFLTPLDLSNRPMAIRGVQQRLELLGFTPGPIDGIEGPLTKAAVEEFQGFCKKNANSGDARIMDAGPVDGIFGPKTRAALLKFFGC